MKDYLEKLLVAFAAILLVILGIAIGSSRHPKGSPIDVIEKVDTLVIFDTIKVSEPIFVKERIIDSIMVAVTDTIVRNDTTFVYLPRQQRQYQSPQFHAWVSGYDPKLDSIKLYQTTKVVTKEIPVIKKEKSRWGLGVQVGYGASKNGLSPYVGIGVSYDLLSW